MTPKGGALFHATEQSTADVCYSQVKGVVHAGLYLRWRIAPFKAVALKLSPASCPAKSNTVVSAAAPLVPLKLVVGGAGAAKGHRQVCMKVDSAGKHQLAAGVNFFCRFVSEITADSGDFTVLHDKVAVEAFIGKNQRAVFYDGFYGIPPLV